MISLFLDTSSSYLNSAIIKDGKVLKNLYLYLEKDMSKLALFKIKEMLEELNITPNKIDKVIVAKGPGSYTGLRVGVTIAKVFTWGLQKELESLSSLYVLASSVTDSSYIVPVIDARRDYLFASIYDKDYNVILEETYIKKEDLLAKTSLLKGSVKYVSSMEIPDFETIKYIPNIGNMQKHMKPVKENPNEIIPNYLKKTEAEENLND